MNIISDSYVYSHIRIDTGSIFYIGIGSGKKYNRAKSKSGRNQHWKNIVSKTGYTFVIILDNVSLEDAYKKEIELIDLYGRANSGNGLLTNQSSGGEGGSRGFSPSESTRQKLRKAAKEYTFTSEHKTAISIGKKNKKQTAAHVEANRLARTGVKQSAKTIAKRVAKLIGKKRPGTGHKWTDKDRLKASIRAMGNKSNTGRKLPSEQVEKIKAGIKRTWDLKRLANAG